MRALRPFVALLVAQLIGTLPAPPQPSQLPPVGQVLSRIRANIEQAKSTLPNVFCDERLSSSVLHDGKLKHQIVLQSTMQAERPSGDFSEFKENRKLHMVNGKPAKVGKKYAPPLLITNGFGSTFNSYFSTAVEACQDFSLKSDSLDNSHFLLLETAVKANVNGLPQCAALQSGGVGRFWLDPESMGIHRYQVVMPDAGNAGAFRDFTSTTSYLPVQLGPRSYLLPAMVRASVTTTPGPYQLTYEAEYSNCHVFASTATIIPEPNQ